MTRKPGSQEGSGCWNDLPPEIKCEIFEWANPETQQFLSSAGKEMRQCLETTYTKTNLCLHLETLRDADIAVKWLILLSRGNLEQARLFRTDDNSAIAEASLHRNIKLQFQPGCRQFTMHSPASPVLLTKNGPLGTLYSNPQFN
eukprot:TRINITY_DN11307_c0_g1_i1.p1 TRINITY_DN11307_c0_g1~~TRINITY_DN11307_c0_g1_i1.p1  ORF type:complete len:144 (-),score=15.04 TRINITY_DN11307_c0_g1_i1:10-441(-)